MELTELISKMQVVFDASGKRVAVQIDWETWKKVLQLIYAVDEQRWKELFCDAPEDQAINAYTALSKKLPGIYQRKVGGE